MRRDRRKGRVTLLRMKSIWVRLLLAMVGIAVAWPASAQVDAHGLEGALKGKQLVLRSYSAEKVASYKWVDGKLVDAPASVHTLGIFVPGSVKEKGRKLSISGTRATLIRDAKTDKPDLAGKSDVVIEIDLNGADPASVLPQLRDMLFFPDVGSAIAGLPDPVARAVPASVPPKVSVDPCNCSKFFRDGEWVEAPLHGPRLKLPSVVHVEQPSYTEEAKQAHVNGSVRFSFRVDTKGEPTDLWLTVSQGYGLDEAAEEALRKYRFAPALYDGKPVEVELGVEINFQTF